VPSKAEKQRAKLLARDGDECWFCGDPLGDDQTIEHLVPKSAGGRNALANYALAHAKCNHDAADLPLIQKVEMRTRLRAKREQQNA
jgi:5-methylcytosine-specific restriction endonuclease McrA